MPEHPFFGLFFSSRIARNASRISLVVGTLSNLINQGEAIVSGQGLSWSHLLLNYLLPYLVASYSATVNERKRAADD